MQKFTKITRKNFHPNDFSRDENDYMPIYSYWYNNLIDEIKLYIADIIALISFGDLADAPPYTGETGKVLACNGAEDGLEFIDPPQSLPYKVYVATITQTGTAAPVATVLQNTLGGTPLWIRNSVGDYIIKLTGEFTENKTTILHNVIGFTNYLSIPTVSVFWKDINNIGYQTLENGVFLDGQIATNATVEIRVYP